MIAAHAVTGNHMLRHYASPAVRKVPFPNSGAAQGLIASGLVTLYSHRLGKEAITPSELRFASSRMEVTSVVSGVLASEPTPATW